MDSLSTSASAVAFDVMHFLLVPFTVYIACQFEYRSDVLLYAVIIKWLLKLALHQVHLS